MIVRVPQIDGEDETALLALWYADPEASVGEASPLPWFWLGEAFWAWEARGLGCHLWPEWIGLMLGAWPW